MFVLGACRVKMIKFHYVMSATASTVASAIVLTIALLGVHIIVPSAIAGLIGVLVYFSCDLLYGLLQTPPCLVRINMLPQTVWDQYKQDHDKGAIERGKRLRVTEIYRVDVPTSLKNKYNAAKVACKKQKVQQLYHGTSRSALSSICNTGFRLPADDGRNMFGPGVYFAKVPQKSSDYAMEGYIIIAEVCIGKTKKLKRPQNYLDPEKDLKTSGFLGLGINRKQCDSAHAPAGASTISDEHIVFNPDLALPKYVIRVYRY